MKRSVHNAIWHIHEKGVIPIVALASLLLAPLNLVMAQGSVSLTVTPPLFQVSIAPGQTWQSSIKVVNSNSYEMPVYATVMDFEASGDAGQGTFKPVLENDPLFVGRTLGNWIETSDEPMIASPGQSVQIPFSISVPLDAEPGGHYAAILIGNKPGGIEGSGMSVSSLISSLIFVKVEGDIIESGKIREFSTPQSMYQTPDAKFTLRFENTGNVHVQPQGHILIYNMWDKERGKIPINEKSDFGNVLPGSVRKYEFEWSGENNFFEVGRYKAIVTVAYGEEGRQTDFWTTYFWVIPVKPALYIFGSFALFMLFIIWSIRRYVRRALEMEKRYMGQQRATEPAQRAAVARRPEIKTLARPLVVGAVDLRSSIQNAPAQDKKVADTPHSLPGFVKKYALFFVFLAVVGVAIWGLRIYLGEVLTAERGFDYEVLDTQIEQ